MSNKQAEGSSARTRGRGFSCFIRLSIKRTYIFLYSLRGEFSLAPLTRRAPAHFGLLAHRLRLASRTTRQHGGRWRWRRHVIVAAHGHVLFSQAETRFSALFCTFRSLIPLPTPPPLSPLFFSTNTQKYSRGLHALTFIPTVSTIINFSVWCPTASGLYPTGMRQPGHSRPSLGRSDPCLTERPRSLFPAPSSPPPLKNDPFLCVFFSIATVCEALALKYDSDV